MAKILVIEDELEMQKGLQDNLEFEGYDVELIGDGNKGLEKMINTIYDLIILDIMLPGMSGFDVCKKAREQGVRIPIIMLTAKGEEIDKVVGLELGADDYITKPFSLRELLARIKAILRRKNEAAIAHSGPIALGKLKIDFAAYTAFSHGKSMEMTPKEFEILKYLWLHRNQVVSRNSLLTDVWGYNENISSRTVDNFILKLRQKIEPDPSHPKHIMTIHGIGYKLIP